MATIVLRSVKGSPLTMSEVDTNFTSLEDDVTDLINHNIAFPGTSLVNDAATNTTRYPTFSADTSGAATTLYTASTKLSYNPSTGQLNSVFFNSTSDARLKTDIEQITNALETITKIKGKTYKFIESGRVSAGVIAQELQTVIPNAVSDRGDGYLSVNYNSIIPYLIEAIKELQTEVTTLKQS